MPNLVIRNITSTPLKLTSFARFPPPGNAPKPITAKNFTDVGNIASNISHFFGKLIPHPSSAQIAANAKAFEETGINAEVPAFSAKDTGVELRTADSLRVEFELVEGGGRGPVKKFRIDVPMGNGLELPVLPRGDVGDTKLHGVFHRARNTLTLVSSAALDSWMGKLPDTTPLAALSMPGTHNSPTCYPALPSVRCQAVSVSTQLANGVRFLDVRVQPRGKDLSLVHGAFPIALVDLHKPLADLAKEVYAFLDAHPSETVVWSLKREGSGKTNDEDFSKLLKTELIDKTPQKWYTRSQMPALRDVRGKCVLFRRFNLHSEIKSQTATTGYGLDAESWTYNTPNDTRGAICVQDFCEVGEPASVSKKIEYVKAHLERSVQPFDANNMKFYVNFLSASNFWRPNMWPEGVADKVNPAVCEHLAVVHNVDGGRAGTGVVVLDYAGEDGNWAICRLVVGMNQGLVANK